MVLFSSEQMQCSTPFFSSGILILPLFPPILFLIVYLNAPHVLLFSVFSVRGLPCDAGQAPNHLCLRNEGTEGV